MCEAKIFVEKDGHQDQIMDNVVVIKPQRGGKLLLLDLFGEEKLVKAKIKEVQLLDHKVILE
jgi:predicted RNA-binding protein